MTENSTHETGPDEDVAAAGADAERDVQPEPADEAEPAVASPEVDAVEVDAVEVDAVEVDAVVEVEVVDIEATELEGAAIEAVAIEAVAIEAAPEPLAADVEVETAVVEAVAEPVAVEAIAEPVVDETAAEPVVDETAAEPAAVEPVTEPAAPAAPRPTPRPMPRPMPRAPIAPATSATSADAPAPIAAVLPPLDTAEAAAALAFGRADDDGTVFVREATGERSVGQYPGATAEDAMAFYVRRFLDLKAKVLLFEARLAATDLPVKEIDQTVTKLTEELAEPAAVGDLDDLRARLEVLRGIAVERRTAMEAERAAAKEAAVLARTDIVEQAEKITSTDPERIQWRPAGEQLRILLDQWKEAQRSGPRIDRPTEESLWKRFSHARTSFDRERRHFFAELETRNAEARAAKEALVAEAERLSTSTDFGGTAAAYRDLMAQWKAAGRASRKDDDALWARFRGAQDTFFSTRDAAVAVTDGEFKVNLETKERLLVEAERLVPIKDLSAAKIVLRDIQDRWESAGKVPRADVQRVEARLRAIETAIRDADASAWTRGNPETRARAEGAAAQLETAIAGLEADLAAARAAGNQRKVAEAQAALDARRSWLEQVQRAADDHRG